MSPRRQSWESTGTGSLSGVPQHLHLTREEETATASEARAGSHEAVQKLVESNLRFVPVVASKYRNRGLSFEDLVGEGNLGLIQAAARFDPARGTRFITYAVWWIRKSILAALWTQSHVVSLPEAYFRKRRDRLVPNSRPFARSGDAADAEAHGVNGAHPGTPCWRSDVSLDDRNGPDATPLRERLCADPAFNPEARLLWSEKRRLLADAVNRLEEREREILTLRLEPEASSRLSYKAIGGRMGLSHERVRQIESEVLRKLATTLAGRGVRVPTLDGPTPFGKASSAARIVSRRNSAVATSASGVSGLAATAI